ncbi:MAG: Holliday junction branch migration protein RuvA [Kiritimatiellae bacterium]|nr:Holliday junction branch migration protein RuvA [Kiritimatiellia bacterium]
MITFLEGCLEIKQPARVVLNVSGVGYEVFITLSSYDRLPTPGQTARILTYDCIREDDHLLFVFMTEAERTVFLLLLNVSGIGPKIAMSALSGLSVRDIKQAIVEGDVKRLSSISGVGKKMAERIVVELRDRLSAGEALEAVAGAQDDAPADQRAKDAVLALISLGYKQADAWKMARAALAALPETAATEDLIRAALTSK